ncbi:FIG00387961: hypothetical protein [hydrothermal vent metagenome]|uniref:AB hydrolase-1 domain-containing protein n=1 Tax=hydrothermal vent metagenome TaxID=652676 RepID=A0A1W1D2Y2_9ZZZZ
MQFYSGFSLKNEVHFFQQYMDMSDFTVAGFSYGAILAFEDVYQKVFSGKRVDRLQLFSPAFFQTKSIKFKRLQTLSFQKNKEAYLQNFISSCFSPHLVKQIEHTQCDSEALEKLLYYEWSLPKLVELAEKNVAIEVYLGEKDHIIDSNGAKDFFVNVATVTSIKDANHFLQTS